MVVVVGGDNRDVVENEGSGLEGGGLGWWWWWW